jgi:hypothetical protein
MVHDEHLDGGTDWFGCTDFDTGHKIAANGNMATINCKTGVITW